MNAEILKGKWNQMLGEVKAKWGEITDDELTQIDGNKDILVGKLQEKYGIEKKEAQEEVENFLSKY